jgi:hypothetical protein
MRKGMFGLGLAMGLLSVMAWAQTGPRIAAVDPTAGKVGANCTVTGENLGKDTVAGVLLSDEEKDYQAEVVEESPDKIVLKVPNVKPGSYNISLRIGNGIYIQPVRFTVQE